MENFEQMNVPPPPQTTSEAIPDFSTMDYYQRLGVGKNASEEEIKKAFRDQSLKYHPDKGGTTDAAQNLGEAYNELSNPDKRKLYDQKTFSGIPSPESFNPNEFVKNTFEDVLGGTFEHGSSNGNEALNQKLDRDLMERVDRPSEFINYLLAMSGAEFESLKQNSILQNKLAEKIKTDILPGYDRSTVEGDKAAYIMEKMCAAVGINV